MSGGLVAKGMEVSFGGVRALRGVDIVVSPGAVMGLIGRNGSGKSTLFNCITGFVRPSGGRVSVDGKDITGMRPHQVVAKGVGRTFQTPRLEARTSVLTAVTCGLYASVRSSLVGALFGSPWAMREERLLRERAEAEMERLGLANLRHVEVGKLSLGLLRLVEVARCLVSGARFVMLDEPAAGLTSVEKDKLAAEVRAVAARGLGVLLVEHNIDMVRQLCRSVAVLETGNVLCQGTPDEVLRNDDVIRSYLGALGDIEDAAGGWQ
ncbi:ABC transporter ATP-binding protein [Bradyrhizobium jicamae]|uniref:ABC transporter ATP-binding protein n=1 Tax=Bradyrhizobium jicamae TaxID=280332 RepID=UPI001BA7EF86|nr:ABC transporter ATP-binding protein [Bradyrhizobium jicamae]MBR0934354.1 ABC transporter ATP-binding protein [Bradyrhizobium jicamae]